MTRLTQGVLFPDAFPDSQVSDKTSSTFVSNMTLPVHRWFRYSAGFSAAWVSQVIREHIPLGPLALFSTHSPVRQPLY
jgi:hypothetical protein